MPRDEDEDLSAPLDLGQPRPSQAAPRGKPSTSKPLAKTAPSPPPPATAPKVGVCGVVHQFGDLLSFPGSQGVIRFISSGVSYTAPPVAARWRAVPSEPGRFEMNFEGDASQARTLRTLRTDLDRAARAGQLKDANHPLLRELDEVANSLVATAVQLHEAGWSLGLIQPENVLIRGRSGEREAVLVDLGFSWKGSFGSLPWEDSPGRPNWLEAMTPNRWLWEQQPVQQQFAAPDNGQCDPADAVSDIRTLGRLFAWLLSGQTSKDVRSMSGASPTWRILTDAAAGRIDSAGEFGDRLRNAPLSDYFVPLEAELAPRRGGSMLVPLLLVGFLALAGAGTGVWYFAIREKPTDGTAGGGSSTEPSPKPPDPKPPEPKPNPGDPAKFEEEVKKFDEAVKIGDFAAMFAGLDKLYALAPPEKKNEIEPRRAKLIEDWVTAVHAAIKLGEDPTKRLDAAARLDELEAELKKLIAAHPAADPAQREKEQQCLDFVATFARQFGPPR